MSSPSPAPHGSSTSPHIPAPPRKRRRWLLLLILAVVPLLCVCACAMSIALVGLVGSPSTETGTAPLQSNGGRSASVVADDFLHAIQSRSYAQAYGTLDSALQVTVTLDDFESQATQADACSGPVISFHLTKKTEGPTSAQYTSRVTRSKRQPYPFLLTLEQSQGNWAITSYGNGNTIDPPGSPSCP